MPDAHTSSVAVRRLVRAIDASAHWLQRVPLSMYGLLLTAALIFRSGVYFLPHTNLDDPDGLQTMPWSDALGNAWLALLKLLDVRERVHYELLGVLSLALAIVLIVWAASRYQRESSKWILILILLGPMGAVLTGYGRHDVSLVVGAVLFVLGGERRPATLILGSLLIVFGNRLQSLALAIGLAVIVLAPQFRSWWKPMLVLLGMSLVGNLGEEFLADQSGRATQADMFSANLSASVEYFLITAPYIMYSLYGVGWSVVIAALVMAGRRAAMLVGISLIFLPIAAMATTVDGMRVGVGVSSVPFLVVSLWVLRQVRESVDTKFLSRALPIFLVVAVIMPALNVGSGGVTAPWDYMWFSVQFWSDVLSRSM